MSATGRVMGRAGDTSRASDRVGGSTVTKALPGRWPQESQNAPMGEKPPVHTEISWDPQAEVRCVHVQECGACPLMPKRYADQRADKRGRLARALERYDIGGRQLPGEAV